MKLKLNPFKRSGPRIGKIRNKKCPCGSAVKFKHCHGARKNRTVFAGPNNVGNYPGKRTPKPLGSPMTSRERFRNLVAMFHLFGGKAAAV